MTSSEEVEFQADCQGQLRCLCIWSEIVRAHLSPTAAVTESGLNFNAPFSPTAIDIVAADTPATRARNEKVARMLLEHSRKSIKLLIRLVDASFA